MSSTKVGYVFCSVGLSVCLLVSNTTQKVINGLRRGPRIMGKTD